MKADLAQCQASTLLAMSDAQSQNSLMQLQSHPELVNDLLSELSFSTSQMETEGSSAMSQS